MSGVSGHLVVHASRSVRCLIGMRASPWLRPFSQRRNPRARLWCLPHAGGSASAYRDWPAALPEDVEVCAIQLPGREDRIAEPAFDDAAELADRLWEVLAAELDRPFSLFGHSMGALIAFELADRARTAGVEPRRLLVSGCRAPHLALRCAPRCERPEREFLDAVREINGAPDAVPADEELMQMMIPTMLRDFRLSELYRYRPRPPLGCPIAAFGGVADAEVTREELCGWARHSAAGFRMYMSQGDHFYLQSSPGRERLLRLIARELSAV